MDNYNNSKSNYFNSSNDNFSFRGSYSGKDDYSQDIADYSNVRNSYD